MQEQANEKTVGLVCRATKMTASMFMRLCERYLRHRRMVAHDKKLEKRYDTSKQKINQPRKIRVKKGYVGAMMSLATLYRENDDMDEYYRWILEAAFVGEDCNAFMQLGELYFEGEYVNQDYEKAYKYFEIASENGADRSKYYIAYYADMGILEPRDMKRAILYYIGGAKEYDERCWERLDELNIKY